MAPQAVGALNNRRFQEFNKAGINGCMDEYLRILTASQSTANPAPASVAMVRTLSGGLAQPPATPSMSSPCLNIRTQLVHSLSDFAWTPSSSFQSPIKPIGGADTTWKSQTHKNPPPIPIKNYIFLVSPLPHSWQDLELFGDATRAANKPNGVMAGPRTSEFIDMLANIKNVFFDQGPWERFVDQNLSLSWIDTRSEYSMQPLQAKVAPGDLYSFATIFAPYKATHIQPSLGLKLSRSAWNPFTSNEIEPNHPVAFIPSTAWRCDLLSQSKSRVCELDLAESGNTQEKSQAQDSFDITLLESVVAIKRIPQCAFSKALLAQGTQSPVSRTHVLCQPMRDKPDQRFVHLLHSLYDSRDVLLLELNIQIEEDQNTDNAQSAVAEGEIRVVPAALAPTVRGSGIIQVLENPIDTARIPKIATARNHHSCNHKAGLLPIRAFSMAMIEQTLSPVGVFVEKIPEENGTCSAMMPPCSFSKAPRDFWAAPCSKNENLEANTDSNNKKAEGDKNESEPDDPNTEIAAIESVDTLCLGVRKAYIKYLYDYKYTVTDFTNKIIATSKEITSLASRQSIPIKAAMQTLVNFIIQFLRISPAKLDSKYKQIGKELHITKMADSKTTTDNYVILQDERPAIDSWKARVMTSVQDDELRIDLKALKTKDTQIQIVQNLQIQMLTKKYELEEIRPMKRDPSVTKSILSLMDRLCIIASIDGTDKKPSSSKANQHRLMQSPETPRSKDMDPAKRFFTRIVKRFYGASLPQLVKVLATKCGAELSSSLLTSPRPNRTAGIARSLSLGVLPRSDPLRSPSAKRVRDVLKDRISKSSGSSSSKDKSVSRETTAKAKDGAGSSSLISEKSKNSVLNNPIFRNRQVTMTRGSLKSTQTSTTAQPVAMLRSQSQSSLGTPATSSTSKNAVEEEENVPQVAKLKLKKFYHDRESEEVLKLFRRKGPLSKADAVFTGTSNSSQVSADDNEGQFGHGRLGKQSFIGDDDDDDDDADLNALRGSTSWGVIKSSSTPRTYHQQAPTSSSLPTDFGRYSSGDMYAEIPASPSSSHVVPATPRSKQGKTSSSLPIHHQDLDDLDEEAEKAGAEDEDIPRTPSRRGFLRRALTDVNDQWLQYAHRTSSPGRTIKVAGTPVGPGPSIVVSSSGGDSPSAPRTPTRSRNRQRRESIQMGLHFASQIRGSPVLMPSSSSTEPWPPSPSGRVGALTTISNSRSNSDWSSPLSKKWGSRLHGVHSSHSNSSSSSSSGGGSSHANSLRSFVSSPSTEHGENADGMLEVIDDDEEIVRSPMKRNLSRMLSIEDSPSSSSSSSTTLSSFASSRKGLLFGGNGSQVVKRART
ncbi:hypothetical protein BGW42_007293 [Actinomortierella wolfii]|nr:hypothetical protein BGW42_007293 [Actinomortierella wolfii]